MAQAFTAEERALLAAARLNVHYRIFIKDEGGAKRDLTDLLGYDWTRRLRWEEDIDQPVASGTFELAQQINGVSIVPTIDASPLNSPGPLIYPGREVEIEAGVTPPGSLLGSSGSYRWKHMLTGRLDGFSVGDDGNLTVNFRDLGAWLLDTKTQEERTYGGNDALASDVMQQIINDNLPPERRPVLYVPEHVEWHLEEFKVEIGASVLERLRDIALQISHDVRYRWNPGVGYRLTFYRPLREPQQAITSFSPDEYTEVPLYQIEDAEVRNIVRCFFIDKTTRKKTPVTLSNPTSIQKHGPRVLDIEEAATSNIDTLPEAERFVESVLSDLEDPLADQEVKTSFFWPIQLHDYYNFLPNGVHYDAAAGYSGSVNGFSHEFADGHGETHIRTRGTPVGAFTTWLQKGRRAGDDEGRYSQCRPVVLDRTEDGGEYTTIQVGATPDWSEIRLVEGEGLVEVDGVAVPDPASVIGVLYPVGTLFRFRRPEYRAGNKPAVFESVAEGLSPDTAMVLLVEQGRDTVALGVRATAMGVDEENRLVVRVEVMDPLGGAGLPEYGVTLFHRSEGVTGIIPDNGGIPWPFVTIPSEDITSEYADLGGANPTASVEYRIPLPFPGSGIGSGRVIWTAVAGMGSLAVRVVGMDSLQVNPLPDGPQPGTWLRATPRWGSGDTVGMLDLDVTYGTDTRSMRVQYSYASEPGGFPDRHVDYFAPLPAGNWTRAHRVEDETGATRTWPTDDLYPPLITLTPYSGPGGTGVDGTPIVVDPSATEVSIRVRAGDDGVIQADYLRIGTGMSLSRAPDGRPVVDLDAGDLYLSKQGGSLTGPLGLINGNPSNLALHFDPTTGWARSSDSVVQIMNGEIVQYVKLDSRQRVVMDLRGPNINEGVEYRVVSHDYAHAAVFGLGNSGSPDANKFYLATKSAFDFAININSLERLRLKADGRLGIGTSAPSEVLHVAGKARADDFKLNGPWNNESIASISGGGSSEPPTGTPRVGSLYAYLGEPSSGGAGKLQIEGESGAALEASILKFKNLSLGMDGLGRVTVDYDSRYFQLSGGSVTGVARFGAAVQVDRGNKSMGFSYATDTSRFYMAPWVDGIGQFGDELSFDFNLSRWVFDKVPYVNNNQIWHAGTFDPATKANLTANTFTGNQTINKSSPALILDRTASGQTTDIYFRSAGINRWRTYATGAVESGGNSGSNFAIQAYADDGTSLGNILTINRSSLNTTFAGDIVANRLMLTTSIGWSQSGGWLRVEGTSGLYAGSNNIRTDGELQVGNNGTHFKANSTAITGIGGLNLTHITSNGTETPPSSAIVGTLFAYTGEPSSGNAGTLQIQGSSATKYTADTLRFKDINVSMVGSTAEVSFDGRYSQLGHSHTFASLTAKPTTLSGYGMTDIASPGRVNTDVNQILTPGFYGLYGDNLNSPSGWSSLIVSKNSDTGLQIAGRSGRLWFRTWQSNASVFTTWEESATQSWVGANYSGITHSHASLTTNNGVTISGTYDGTTARTIGLTGNALQLHNIVTDGIVIRSGATMLTRSVVNVANQTTVTNGDGKNGNITIGTVQNIHTSATPQFLRLGLGRVQNASYSLTTGGIIRAGDFILDAPSPSDSVIASITGGSGSTPPSTSRVGTLYAYLGEPATGGGLTDWADGLTFYNGHYRKLTDSVPWSSVDKTGSSLAHLATRNAADLTGTLNNARLPQTISITGGITAARIDRLGANAADDAYFALGDVLNRKRIVATTNFAGQGNAFRFLNDSNGWAAIVGGTFTSHGDVFLKDHQLRSDGKWLSVWGRSTGWIDGYGLIVGELSASLAGVANDLTVGGYIRSSKSILADWDIAAAGELRSDGYATFNGDVKNSRGHHFCAQIWGTSFDSGTTADEGTLYIVYA